MNWKTEGDMLCMPQDEETKRRFMALQSLLALYDPSVDVTGTIGPESIAAVNRLGFSFNSCNDIANNIDDIVEMLGAVVVDPSGKMVVKKSSGFPWWLLLLAGGGLVVWNYSRPKAKRWF